jgi:hypothetical protein
MQSACRDLVNQIEMMQRQYIVGVDQFGAPPMALVFSVPR